jgi:hypothetical protein
MEEFCARAAGGIAWTVGGAPWTEPFAGRTVEGGRCAPGFSVWTEQGAPGSLHFFARALERVSTRLQISPPFYVKNPPLAG